MLKAHLSIIGLDANFGGYSNIDLVERAFYQGSVAKQFSLATSADKSKLVADSVARLASTNNLNIQDINIIELSQNTDLALALTQSEILIAQNKLVALVGVNIFSSTDEDDLKQKSATISFDESFISYNQVEGIVSILIAHSDFARQNALYIYSNIKSFAVGDNVTQTSSLALEQANITAEQVHLLEVSANADKTLSDIEQQGLLQTYQNDSVLNTALSCAKSVTGEGGEFSQLAGLLKCIISLQQRYIPAINEWQNANSNVLSLYQTSAFYIPTESRPWYPNSDGSAHIAAYSCQTTDNYCQIILEENLLAATSLTTNERFPVQDIRNNGFIANGDLSIFLLSADDEKSLLDKMASLNSLTSLSLKELAKSCFAQFDEQEQYAVVLLGESLAELNKEISLAEQGITKAFLDDSNWKTPKGSFFTAKPVGKGENISFMYPGIGATYVGLGRDLFHLFPQIYQSVAALADDIAVTLKDTLLNPRSINRLGFKALKQRDLALRGSLADIAEAGVGYACVFTKIFEDVFNVKADFATGYSMGEVSMYAALGCWQQPGIMSARLAASDTFNNKLCGDLLTLRDHWNMPKNSDDNELIWETYTIKATVEEFALASTDEPKVFCTIVNTPDSLLVAGYPPACQKVIKKLGVRAMALNMANAIHSAPAYSEYNDMTQLYTMDVTERIKTKMYSSSCYLPIPQRSKAIATSIAKCLCDRVDFPRLVNTLHKKGAQVFIEMGPGRSLSSWVDKILDSKVTNNTKLNSMNHLSVPVNAKGTSDELTYMRAVAKLVSHGVIMELSHLFHGSMIVKK
ncbi:polyunsaturated fatty acid synthase PfaB [Pseudoalteromonas sp. NBT06-2]|uniref:PfaB family protein n=1 Tax=Pseudoalteromonas sp. NBT06-2 TaxID=2025950 RepID=UPI000BA60A2A|nr:PfaB family protein [Pseudoalteromonas sp. NBT06-2]PAJ72187.1 polyunsaturated fatty acid synthase PfaB [Pseudoalteromonas sp. NBT06-2]